MVSNTYSNGAGEAVFYGGDVVPSQAFRCCYNLSSVSIPQNTKTIGSGAFSSCYDLTYVDIPNSVTKIGDGSFSGCSLLEEISLPEKLSVIGPWAFKNCRSLTEVTIPGGVTSIGDEAFSGCNDLTKVYCKPVTPPEVTNYIFGWPASARNIKIYVPAQSYDLYYSTKYWYDYYIYVGNY